MEEDRGEPAIVRGRPRTRVRHARLEALRRCRMCGEAVPLWGTFRTQAEDACLALSRRSSRASAGWPRPCFHCKCCGGICCSLEERALHDLQADGVQTSIRARHNGVAGAAQNVLDGAAPPSSIQWRAAGGLLGVGVSPSAELASAKSGQRLDAAARTIRFCRQQFYEPWICEPCTAQTLHRRASRLKRRHIRYEWKANLQLFWARLRAGE